MVVLSFKIDFALYGQSPWTYFHKKPSIILARHIAIQTLKN